MKKITVGMIGAGMIASRHCEDIQAHSQAEVVAVADPSAERAQALKETFNLSRIYQTAADLIADPDLDAVTIAVPNVFHADYAIAALRAGKHVMLDKPFAITYAEAEQVAAEATRSGKVFMVGMNMRFEEDAQRARALIDNGQIGDIYHSKAYWFRRSGIPKLGTWFGKKEMAGGGVLLDIGVHLLDLSLFLIDNFEAEAVTGLTHRTFGHRGLGEGGWGLSTRDASAVFDVEDFATALIRLKGGATVTLEVAWAIHQEDVNRHNVEIFGSEGGLTAFNSRLCRFGPQPGEYQVTEPEKIAVPHPHGNRFINWIDAILDQAELVCTLEQALAVQKILNGIYTSAQTGREVRF
jgi:predicted dehydrogenase